MADAKVEIRTEYTVLTPGGGNMAVNYPGTALKPAKPGQPAWYTDRYSSAVAKATEMNNDLTEAGIDDRCYEVVERTITTVTTDWGTPG
jgi:hypothetical protein